MILTEPNEYVDFLAPYPEGTQELARGLRNRLVDLLPPCIETVWDATNAVGVAYGFSELNRDHFIHLPVYTKYVNIGFSDGASLSDPEQRLKGSGARIRHIKLTRVDDLDDPYLHGLIAQACQLAKQPSSPITPQTIIRVMDGPKRRPKPV